MIHSKIKTQVKGQERVDKLKAQISKYSEAYVTIGVHEGAGVYPDGQSVLEVALWNEFGTEKIPARSFVRAVADENLNVFEGWRQEMITNILEHNWSVEKALEAMGLRIQILIQNKIKSNVPPPLAQSTMEAKVAKGRPAVTLIDTGLMLRSITYKVHLK